MPGGSTASGISPALRPEPEPGGLNLSRARSELGREFLGHCVQRVDQFPHSLLLEPDRRHRDRQGGDWLTVAMSEGDADGRDARLALLNVDREPLRLDLAQLPAERVERNRVPADWVEHPVGIKLAQLGR
jgi:hypothetical protein